MYWPIKLQSKTSHLQKLNLLKIAWLMLSMLCPEGEAVSLSRRTIVHRIDGIAVNIQEQLLTASGSFQLFSISLDERTDIQDTAQLLTYLRGIDENFEMTEEMLPMKSLKDTVTGKDLYNCVINCLIRSGLSLDKLASITTEGAPSLIDKYSGLVKLMNDKIKEDYRLHSVLSFHCIIKERLCKSLKTKTCYGSSGVCSEFNKSTWTETQAIPKFLGRHRGRFYRCAVPHKSAG